MINKILYLTDIHIKIKNLNEIDLLKKYIMAAKNVSLIIIGGDVLNKRFINYECEQKAKELIRLCSKVAITYVLVGNHDYIDEDQFLTDKHWMNDLKNWPNVVIVDKVITIFCGFKITCVPYVANGRLVEALDSSKTPWKDSMFVFAHQEIKGCDLGRKISSDGDVWDPSYPTLISGHIHKRQTIGNNVIYPGSVLPHGYTNNYQQLCFINTFLTSNKNRFSYNIKYFKFPTTEKSLVFVKTLDDLHNLRNKKLTNTLVVIEEYNIGKKEEMKQSQIYKEIVFRSYHVFFAD